MSVWNRLREKRRSAWGGTPATETGGGSPAAKMRALAVKYRPEGRGKLRMRSGLAGELKRLERRAGQIRSACLNAGPALESLTHGIRLMEACAEQAEAGFVADLPSSGGKPRILTIAEALIRGGDMRLNRETLMLALASFDDVQALEMAELWSMPEALRICIAEAYREAAAAAVEIAAERRRAEQWAADGQGRIQNCTAAFLERALCLLAEQEDGGLHDRLEQRMRRDGLTAEQAVQAAHSHEALARMRLENLLSVKRMLDALDWSECFEEISQVESELRYDPAGVYPAMEQDSRAAVRDQVAVIARRLGVGELTVARYAVSAAQAAQYEEADSCTVCRWLYDDVGRAELLKRMGMQECRLPAMVPDPGGSRSAWGLVVGAISLYLVFQAAARSIWLVFPAIPVAWCAATALAGRIFPGFVKPAKLLKMKIDRVPDNMRTLVVMPALLSSKERAAEICDQMEALGCLERDENISMLILGDFADGDAQHVPGDEEITGYVRARVHSMNERAGRQQYFYLHRGRRLLEAEGRWMGRDRKRGALMDLNRLLLGKSKSEQAFEAEGSACAQLAGRFPYVLTIDADTCFLPGTVQRMLGAIAHPLNAPRTENGRRRGFAVLQPRMEMMAGACVNGFVRLFSGEGGLNAYPVSVSDFWQDLTGEGIFGGKGIYAVRPFMKAMEDSLPEGRILSHDLIEGTLSRAALLGDVSFYDGFPSALGSFLRRLNRWTRGDWQLLPLLLSARKYPADARPLSFAARIRLADNLLRSLYAPALLGVLTTAVWLGNAPAFVAGLLSAFSAPLLSLPKINGAAWKRALLELAVLPAVAACTADAVLRTLWRLAISGKHLLDWVTAADSEGMQSGSPLPCRAAAILMLPGLLVPGWAAAAAGLAILFLIGPKWIEELEAQREGLPEPDEETKDAFLVLAGDIWKFFERCVTQAGNHLPPDNLQVDPDTGTANRTSPTNIGLYLMSCAAAKILNLIDSGEMLGRMERTVEVVEGLEKWNGHLFNWYDTVTLEKMSPAYVSSVDSGNFAATLLLCSSLVNDEHPALARRMEALARQTDFTALYDSGRNLFRIGMDVDRGCAGESHYDLLASESRILSYTAMMLGDVPLKHWERLSRSVVNVRGRATLLSWSGTMFEYLMPELMLHAPKNTLLGDAVRGAAEAQMEQGRRKKRPWGVSESGYCAFDIHLNYQYRAFGLRELALSGNASDGVTAPYASVLAASVCPEAVMKNIGQMQACGWRGEYGFYEAADYQHSDAEGRPRVVRSYMAHHQGMALCALCNALTGQKLAEGFMRIPEARALRLLMEEKQSRARKAAGAGEELRFRSGPHRFPGDARTTRPGQRMADTHVLGGAGATALITADGAVHYRKDGILATRFDGDLLNRNDGACVHIRRERDSSERVLGGAGKYLPGKAVYTAAAGPVSCTMTVCISPEDGALLKRIEVVNESDTMETVRISDCAPVALGRSADLRAHAAFRNLFVESERISNGAVRLKRRKRAPEEHTPVLLHLVSAPGKVRCETDYEKLVGRMGSTLRGGGICREMSDTVGAVLNPCSALQCSLSLEPGQSAEVHFAMGLADGQDEQGWLRRNFADSACERAEQLAQMQAKAMLGFLGIEPGQHHLLQRMAAFLEDPHLSAGNAEARGEAEPLGRSDLWSLGISGDLPILMMHVGRKEETARVRELIRMHEFYRTLGIAADLVLINEHGNDYDQPVRDGIAEAVAASPLNEARGMPGGVHIVEGGSMTQSGRRALSAAAAIELDAAQDLYAQIRYALRKLNRSASAPEPMDTGRDCLHALPAENGYGMFLADGRYAIDVSPERTTPAPWANLLANDHFGVLLTERGGGFLWAENSRSGRMTPFHNDVLNEGWGWMFYLVDEEKNTWMRLLPGRLPGMRWRVTHSPCESVFCFDTERLSGETAFCVHPDAKELRVRTTLKSAADGRFRLVGFVDWLMGTDTGDAGFVRSWNRDGAGFAQGAAGGVGCFAAANARVRAGGDRTGFLGEGGIQSPDGLGGETEQAGGYVLSVPLTLKKDRPAVVDWMIGHAQEPQQAYAKVRAFYGRSDYDEIRGEANRRWQARMKRLNIETPDETVNAMANGWLQHQTLTSRVQARTGLYQPGGAYGFRDQLQDMLALLPFEPGRVREHILRCAARQFEDGDVMHWWHEPFLGVRTRISDDLLFLPYVTAQYVRWTQDEGILHEKVRYLKNVEIGQGKEDVFCEMEPGGCDESLHAHCMRAFRRAARTGEHGLALMGSGDWNDGMNRVGIYGMGESVWLSEFLAACAAGYAQCLPPGEDRTWLIALSDRMSAAVEENGWDGEWYLRAFMDSGTPLGSASGSVCRIDVISQVWAVLAGLDQNRCEQAVDAAWRMLADERNGVIRLLAPPFDREDADPGYIRGYPGGVRENGAQYTHAACWLLLALIRMGDEERAHRALAMLMPAGHACTREAAEVYRVEPYVLAADVYDGEHVGRGGWTWYTGSAAWLYRCILALLGFEREGDRVRMHALLGDWAEASVTLEFGRSKYRLTCRRDVCEVLLDGKPVQDGWILLADDGEFHEAVFPARKKESMHADEPAEQPVCAH